jgi:2,4-dienoyl-CoA reductase-like NADH-dependent reductase (Old Yellow Enzyme family)
LATCSTGVDALFQPFTVGSLKLLNRIVMAPMSRSFSPGGVPGIDVAQYYKRRKQGGVKYEDPSNRSCGYSRQ